MIRRRRRKDFDDFPGHSIEDKKILVDTRKMDYMSKFRDWHVKTVFYYALLGMTEDQIATAFEISVTTLQHWKNKFPTFLQALKSGREQADSQVVYSLYQLAVGYEYDTEQIITVKTHTYTPQGRISGEQVQIIHEPVRKKLPPNAKAAIKWLETRQPEHWTQRKQVDGTITHKHEMDFSALSLEELRVLRKLGDKMHDVIDVTPFTTTVQQERAEESQEPQLKETEGDEQWNNQ